jgi:anti-anti-sigma factor
MNNDVQQDASCSLFQFEGELRADHIEGLKTWVLPTGQAQARNLLIDCRKVDRFSQDTLEALVDLQRRVSEQGGKVVVVGIHHPALEGPAFLDKAERTSAGCT